MRTGVYKCTWNGTDYPSEGYGPEDAAKGLAMSLNCAHIASREDLDGTVVVCDGRGWRIDFQDTPEHWSARWVMTFTKVTVSASLPGRVREAWEAKHGQPMPEFIEDDEDS